MSGSDSESEVVVRVQPPTRFHDELPLFSGNVTTLARSNPVPGSFVPPRYLQCAGGTRLYFAVLDKDVAGGERRLHEVQHERLLVLPLTGEPDFFNEEGFGRDHLVPAQLFWLNSESRLRRAKLYARGDTEGSLTFTAYNWQGEQVAPLVHRVLAFTFFCPPRI